MTFFSLFCLLLTSYCLLVPFCLLYSVFSILPPFHPSSIPLLCITFPLYSKDLPGRSGKELHTPRFASTFNVQDVQIVKELAHNQLNSRHKKSLFFSRLSFEPPARPLL